MFEHHTVLREEAASGLAIKQTGAYIDCTVGGGGHAEKIALELGKKGLLIAFDQDANAIEAAKARLAPYLDKIIFINENFRYLETELKSRHIENVDGVLFDLGVSSPQLDRGERGFSYHQDAPLDMRMNQNQELDAGIIVNTYPYEQLVKIFFEYGEEKFSKQIARKIESNRKTKPILTTRQLAELIKEAIPAPARRKGGHPAKRVFQAIRIAVNDEMEAFKDALHQAARVVSVNGRIAVITFHSLEDRLCKQAFKKWSTAKEVPRNFPVIPKENEAPFKIITKKPVLPSDHELEKNRRARSAKLRIVEKVKPWNEDFAYQEGWKKP